MQVDELVGTLDHRLAQLGLDDDRVLALGNRVGDLVAQVGAERLDRRVNIGLGDLRPRLLATATRGLGIEDARLRVLREAAQLRVDALVDDDIDLTWANVGVRACDSRLRGNRDFARRDPSADQPPARHDHVGLRCERLLPSGDKGARRNRHGRGAPVEEHDLPGRRLEDLVRVGRGDGGRGLRDAAKPLRVFDLDHVGDGAERLPPRNQGDRGRRQDGGTRHEADEQHRGQRNDYAH